MPVEVAAQLIEIFSSIQGEGVYIGAPQTFLRFQGCQVGCSWCDTPASFEHWTHCRVEDPPGSKYFKNYPNPVSANMLLELLRSFPRQTLSLTGGEPLEQAPFLKYFLPPLKRSTPIFLETAGVHPDALESIIEWVDTVSMDLKLPSSTKIQPYWGEHAQFLRVASQKSVYCKIVLTPDTSAEDLIRACELIAAVDVNIFLILQPVSNHFKTVAMEYHLKTAARYLRNIKILPQLHKLAGWL